MLRAATPSPSPLHQQPALAELAAKIQWLMLFRVLMISVLLGATMVFNFEEIASLNDPLQVFFLGLTIGVYLLTLVYAFVLPRTRRLALLAHVQLSGDVLLYAALVWGTGGSESIFTFIFSLAIINGATILYRPGALITATTSSVAFVGLVVLESTVRSGGLSLGWSNLSPDPTFERSLYFVTYIHVATFYLVAMLASYLAELLRRAGRRIQAQAADIERFREINDKIVGSITSGLITVHQGRITFFNRAAERITGLREAQTLQRPVGELFPGMELPATRSGLQPALSAPAPPAPEPLSAERTPTPAPVRTRSEDRTELDFTRPDGGSIRLGYRATRLVQHLGAEELGEGLLVLFEDITRLRQLEEGMRRSQRLASLGQLAAGIAHEVRNPLASISGSVQLLSAVGQGSSEDRALLEIIQRETDRLERLIASFLGFSRPSSRGRQPVGVRELISVTLKMFENDPVLKEGVRCTAELPEEHWVLADPDQLEQVLWNLLTNAAQAMAGRRGTIRVATVSRPSAEESGTSWVEITVADQGEGMTEAVRARIFDPFFTTRASGTGLGLATVHRIVDEHGGLLDVKSEPGQGTQITILLREVPRRRGLADERPASLGTAPA